MALTPEEKKRLEEAVDGFGKAATELGEAVKVGFLSTAKAATTGLKAWLDEIEKTLDKSATPADKKEK